MIRPCASGHRLIGDGCGARPDRLAQWIILDMDAELSCLCVVLPGIVHITPHSTYSKRRENASSGIAL
jgi:hypothetical protein